MYRRQFLGSAAAMAQAAQVPLPPADEKVASGAGVRIARSVHLSKDPKVLRNELGEMLAIYRRIVVKPVAGGSSVGLYHVASAEEAERAARGIDESGEACLAEEFVSGTELTVGIVDGPSGPRALPASEVRARGSARSDASKVAPTRWDQPASSRFTRPGIALPSQM